MSVYGVSVEFASPTSTWSRMSTFKYPEAQLGRPRPRVEVRRSPRRRRTVTAYRERDAIVVLIPQAMSRADERRFVDDLVRKVLEREAKRAAPQGDPELADRAGVLVNRYLAAALREPLVPRSVNWVTNQSQRWGSCTPSSGAIRLSHRLQPLPSWVVDYVLIHELVHLVEPTHSARFWQLVTCFPESERAKGFLEGYLAGKDHAPADATDVD
jgi:predicted metal-dependent hydrolase